MGESYPFFRSSYYMSILEEDGDCIRAFAAYKEAKVIAAPESWLAEQGVAEWAGPRSLPLWLADADWQGFTSRSGERARAAGLPHRPLDETLRDVLAWEGTQPEHPHGAGLADDEERDLLRLLTGD